MAEGDGVRNRISGTVAGNAVQIGVVHGDVYLGGTDGARWPRRVGVVPQRADCFQQRDVSATVAEAVHETGTAVLTQVLAGLGGVGKTQLAAEFAEERWAADEVDLLVWITAGSREAIVSGYATAAAEIGQTASTGEERACTRFLEWLAETDRRWLIVLDDVQDPGHLRRLWPPQRPNGRVVVTTRRRDAALSGNTRRLIEVGLFSEAEAVSYLEAKLADRPELAEGAAGLAADVGHLPLALAQAAAYLVDRNLTCADYRRRLADRRRRLADLLPESGSLPDDHHSTVAATWSLSVEWADQLTPVGLARPLLELAAFLDPNGIPGELFTTSVVMAYLGEPDAVDADQAWDALHNLHRLSLAAVDPTDPHRSVRVHALVQRAIREPLPQEHRALVAQVAGYALLEMWPTIDTSHGHALRANTEHLHTQADTDLWTPEAHLVLFRAGRSLGEAGLVAEAADHHQRLHAKAQQTLGPDHTHALSARNHIARWRGESGDAAGAVAAYEELLADVLRVLGPEHPHTLSTRHNIAFWRGHAGDAAGAAGSLEELLADRLRVLGPDHQDTLATRHNIAFWRGHAGDTAGAVAAFEELLTAMLRVLRPDHPETLTTRENIAIWQGHAGDAAGAVTAAEELLADRLRVLGPDHPDTLTARGNVAFWRGNAGDASGAATAFEELLPDMLRIVGPDHPHTVIARGNIAFWWGEAGNAVRAAKAYEDLLTDRLRVLSPDHPQVLTIRGHIAFWQNMPESA